MKFSVHSKALFNLASNVGRVICQRNAIASLNNFLCTVEGNNLTLTGSDIESSLSGTIEIFDSWSDGKFQIDARRLTSLLKELAEQPVTVSVNEENYEIEVATANGHYSMVGMAADQYPTFKKCEDAEGETKAFECSAELILKGVESTSCAIGNDDYRPQMCGILVEVREEGLTFVATDTRKLVRFTVSSVTPGIEASLIMPSKAASIAKGIFAKTDSVRMELASNIGVMMSETYTFVFSCIKGRFPDYTRVIPKNNPYVLSLNRKELLNSMRRVNIFGDPGMGMVKAKPTADRLLLKTTDSGLLSQGMESVACSYEGEEIAVGLSASYLIELCNAIPSDDIVWSMSDPSRPLIFTPAQSPDNEDFLALLMPMCISEY